MPNFHTGIKEQASTGMPVLASTSWRNIRTNKGQIVGVDYFDQ